MTNKTGQIKYPRLSSFELSRNLQSKKIAPKLFDILFFFFKFSQNNATNFFPQHYHHSDIELYEQRTFLQQEPHVEDQDSVLQLEVPVVDLPVVVWVVGWRVVLGDEQRTDQYRRNLCTILYHKDINFHA